MDSNESPRKLVRKYLIDGVHSGGIVRQNVLGNVEPKGSRSSSGR